MADGVVVDPFEVEGVGVGCPEAHGEDGDEDDEQGDGNDELLDVLDDGLDDELGGRRDVHDERQVEDLGHKGLPVLAW